MEESVYGIVCSRRDYESVWLKWKLLDPLEPFYKKIGEEISENFIKVLERNFYGCI
jgi:hypothetical protein